MADPHARTDSPAAELRPRCRGGSLAWHRLRFRPVDLILDVPLIVAREIDRWSAMQRQLRHAADLRAIVDTARILTERRFNGVPEKIGAGDVMEVAHFAATQTREIAFRLIGARAFRAVSLLVIDPLHFVFRLQVVPA